MSWGTRANSERAAEQPVPERERVHHATPAGTGQRIIGGNTRARAAVEAAHPEKTQQELNIERLMAHGLAEIAKRDEEQRKERQARIDRNNASRARSEQQDANAKAAGELQERRCERILADGRRQEITTMLIDRDVTSDELEEMTRRLKAQGLLSEPWAWNLELEDIRRNQ